MNLFEFLHITDPHQPRRIMLERRGRGRFVGWLMALALFALLVGIWWGC